jgi:hypothetical protein
MGINKIEIEMLSAEEIEKSNSENIDREIAICSRAVETLEQYIETLVSAYDVMRQKECNERPDCDNCKDCIFDKDDDNDDYEYDEDDEDNEGYFDQEDEDGR